MSPKRTTCSSVEPRYGSWDRLQLRRWRVRQRRPRSATRCLRFRVCGEEIPQDFARRDPRARVERRIVGGMVGIVHRAGTPGMRPSNELVEFYFGVSAATGRVLFRDRADIALAIA